MKINTVMAISALSAFLGAAAGAVAAHVYETRFEMPHKDPVVIASPRPEVTIENLPPLVMRSLDAVNYTKDQRHCLSLNIYHEAKNQAPKGQMAVAFVTLNRVVSKKFPNNVCDVVKQAKYYKWKPDLPIKNRCHFSWWCDGKNDTPRNATAWSKAQYFADLVLDTYETEADPTDGALWYHANHVKPKWRNGFKRIKSIGTHIFYKES